MSIASIDLEGTLFCLGDSPSVRIDQRIANLSNATHMTHKSTTALLAFLVISMMSAPLQSQTACDAFSGCAVKQCELENQLKLARQHGQHDREAGLQTALNEVRAHCTQRSINAKSERHVLGLKDRVIEKENKVAQRQEDLRQAKLDGNARKVAQKQQRLDQAVNELKQAESNLNSAGTRTLDAAETAPP